MSDLKSIRDEIYKLRLSAKLEVDSIKRQKFIDRANALSIEYRKLLFVDLSSKKNGGRKK